MRIFNKQNLWYVIAGFLIGILSGLILILPSGFLMGLGLLGGGSAIVVAILYVLSAIYMVFALWVVGRVAKFVIKDFLHIK